METDLTRGSVFKTILRFSLPYLLSYFLQTLYGLVDLFVIGRYSGVESTTAVSAGSQVMHLITVVIVGMAMGTTVVIGRAVGAKKEKEAARAVGNTAVLFTLVAVVLTVVLIFTVKPLVKLMATPEEAVPEIISYLTICFAGVPFITAYNIICAIFRGLGDSKTPMYFIAVACGVNIALDYLFIGGMGMNAAGAAWATILAQGVSVVLSLIVIVKRKAVRVSRKDLRPVGATMGNILRIGVPVAVQDGIIQVAFIVVTVFANKRGLNDAAAVGVVEKIISMLFLVPSSMLSSVSAIGAQDVGAKEHGRAKKTLWYAIALAVGWGVVCVIVMEIAPAAFVGLFTSDAEVRQLGAGYLRGYVFDCVFAGVHFCFSGYFCAYGRSGISFLHNVLSAGCVRIPIAYVASRYYAASLFPMGLAAPAGSLLSVIVCVIAFNWLQKDKTRLLKNT